MYSKEKSFSQAHRVFNITNIDFEYILTMQVKLLSDCPMLNMLQKQKHYNGANKY